MRTSPSMSRYDPTTQHLPVVREECFPLGEAERKEGLTEGQQQQGTQKLLEPAAEQAEVVAGGGEHGIDAVAVAAFEIIATHPMIVLEMADDRLDGGATAHLATDGFGDPADLA